MASEAESKYSGNYNAQQQRHGHGVTIYPNGDTYKGEYKGGYRNGKGIYGFASGAYYDGDWLQGKKHGHGTFTYRDGSRYKGHWRDDKRNGQGEYRYANGDRYVGHWNDHVRQGLGTYTYGMHRMQFIGWWDEDQRTNDGELTVFDGDQKQAVIKYRITVHTGIGGLHDRKTNVYVTLFGSQGETEEILLERDCGQRFQTGVVDHWIVEAASVGCLDHLRVRHDNAGDKESWYINEIEVEDIEMDEKFKFDCRDWFSLHQGDGVVDRLLRADGVSGGYEQPYISIPHYENEGYEDHCEPWIPIPEYSDEEGSKLDTNIVLCEGALIYLRITVKTGRKGLNAESKVYITLVGKLGETDEIHLERMDKDDFSKDSVNYFTIESCSLGHLQKLIVRHDNAGVDPGWYLDSVVVQDLHNYQHYLFACHQLLANEVLETTLDAELLEEDRLSQFIGQQDPPVIYYRITIKTGSKALDAEAKAYIVLLSEHGESEEILLERHEGDMAARRTDYYTVKSLAMGSLHRLRIRHDNGGSAPGWFVESVVVQDLKTYKKYRFICGEWLAKDQGDGNIERELHVEAERPSAENQPVIYYRVVVHTGKKGLDLEAKAFVALSGLLGDSDDYLLERHGKEQLKSGGEDEFTIKTHFLGPLEMLRISHDDGGSGTGWFIDSVTVQDLKTYQKYNFPCKQWLAEDQEDKQLERELIVEGGKRAGKKSAGGQQQVIYYRVIVHTGEKALDPEAKAFVALFGDHGETKEMLLERHGHEEMMSGGTDDFTLEALSVGRLQQLKIRHDNAGSSPGWFINSVTVQDLKTYGQFNFPCSQWLAQDQGDGKLERTLIIEGGFASGPTEVIYYRVIVHTGEKALDPEAKAFVALFGDHGETKEMLLERHGHEEMMSGGTDDFTLEALSVGRLQQLKIRHDNAGSSPGWFINSVTVQDLKTYEQFNFPCSQWLAQDQGDGKIERTLIIEGVFASGPTEVIYYRIVVHTGQKALDHEASAYIVLMGEQGKSTKLHLQQVANEVFEIGATDDFVFEMQSLGGLKKVLISHDNLGTSPGWFIDNVTVQDLHSYDEYKFPCNQWLAADQADGQLERELTTTDKPKFHDEPGHGGPGLPGGAETGDAVASSAREGSSGGQQLGGFASGPTEVIYYRIVVHTGQKALDHEASAYIVLMGEQGKSTKLHLQQVANEVFEIGATDDFVFEMQSLGGLKKVLISHDNLGTSPGWFIDSVTVQDLHSYDEYKFTCNQWLAADQADGQLERELTTTDKPKFHDEPGHGGPGLPGGAETGDAVASSAREGSSGGQQLVIYYQVTVHTGEKGLPAGTEAFVVLYGQRGESIEFNLERHGTEVFDHDRQDSFTLESKSLGALKQLKIRHNSSDSSCEWFVGNIYVQELSTYTTYEFPCKQWLAASKGDGAVERILDAVGGGTVDGGKADVKVSQELKRRYSSPSKARRRIINYKISVHTGTLSMAGTDAKAYIVLYGDQGPSEEMYLDQKGENLFENGMVNEFILPFQWVGILDHIRLRHDNTGVSPGWYVDEVIVEDLETQDVYTFPCKRWLARDEDGDANLSRVMSLRGVEDYILVPPPVSNLTDGDNEDANVTGQTKPDGTPLRPALKKGTSGELGQIDREVIHYKVIVHTADKNLAGTDAKVSIILHGEFGDSDQILLDQERNNLFERGSVDQFFFQTKTVGRVYAITLSHDNTGISPGWFVDHVTVEDMEAMASFDFPVGQWFSKNEGDGLISREIQHETKSKDRKKSAYY